MDMYEVQKKIGSLCKLLYDDKSKDVFWGRVKYDADPCDANAIELNGQFTGHTDEWDQKCSEKLEEMVRFARSHETVLIYGTQAMGRHLSMILKGKGVEITGFCGRRHDKYSEGLFGKPVYSPEWLFAHADSAYVIVAAGNADGEIFDILRKHDFPQEHIYREPFTNAMFSSEATASAIQYFEFPQYYKKGTAFVDAGCYDLGSSKQFAKLLAENDDTAILAFEPDKKSYARCLEAMQASSLKNIQLFEAGLSNHEEIVSFDGQGDGHSRFSDLQKLPEQFIDRNITQDVQPLQNVQKVRTVRLDDVVGEYTVGMIKMDIEGAEYAALHGAEKTIVKDRPLLAICVYHFPGDVLAIMEYLHEVVPEYRFLLRQYAFNYLLAPGETVLYAFVP